MHPVVAYGISPWRPVLIDPLAGQTFGQYELHAQIGQGGMATVYRGFQPSLGRAVAVKVLPLSRLTDPTLPARFRREAQLAASLMHPNIVPVYDFGEWEGYLFIVMALVAGGTLKDRMQAPLPVDAIVHLVGQIADGLGFAHAQGIFHRDVKPTNVLLAAADWALLGDFGIARALGDVTRLTSPYGTIGTPAYMAPEQWLGGEVDGRADLYALGIVLYEMLIGRPPFTAATAEGLMRQHLEMPVPELKTSRLDLPAGFEDVVQIALSKAPEQRFRHAGELKAALITASRQGTAVRFASQTSLASPGASPTTSPDLGPTLRVEQRRQAPEREPQRPRSSGVPFALVVLALVLIVLLAGVVGYVVAGTRQEPTVGTSAAPPATVAPTIPPEPTTAPLALTPQPTVTGASAAPKPTVVQPTVPAKAPPSDQRSAQIERRVSDYFAALNAGDYARAQAVCCTPGFRSRYPLDSWQRNFAGVSDLRFATPFRYASFQPRQVVVDVDYSFANSSGTRRYFTLRWAFVPVGDEWLADEATASPQ